MKKINKVLFFALFIFISFCFTNKSFAETQTFDIEKIYDGWIDSVILQPDGKILIIYSNEAYKRRQLVRLNQNGSIDTTFNVGSNMDYFTQILAPLVDGKILFEYTDNTGIIRVIMLNNDGSIDTSFNPIADLSNVYQMIPLLNKEVLIEHSGWQRISKLSGYSFFNSGFNPQIDDNYDFSYIEPLSDGKILVATYNIEEEKFYITKLDRSGSLVSSCNTSIKLDIGALYTRHIMYEKILIRAIDFHPGTGNTSFIILNEDCSIDTSFNPEIEMDYWLIPQKDGKILSINYGYKGNKIFRLNTDGSIDTSFNSVTNNMDIEISIATAIQSDGKLLVVYAKEQKTNMLRLNLDGSLDTSFNLGAEINDPGVVPPIITPDIFTIGTWIKTEDRSTVYFLDINNIRHSYPNEAIWYSYFEKDFSFVETISKEELANYTLGKNVPFKFGALIKIPSIPKVYKVGDDGLIHWIKTEEKAIELYGAEWNKLVNDVLDSLFGDYTIGSDIE